MNAAPRLMTLAAIVQPGPYTLVADEAWPASDTDFGFYRDTAATLERGLFDILFLGDTLGVGRGVDLGAASRSGNTVALEPFALLSALAVVTRHIGLVGTISTTYNHPYHVARKVAALDVLSGGRAGWNLVTSTLVNEARNFGLAAPLDAAARYARADEFLDAVTALWDSWADSAFVRNKADARYFDPAGLRFRGVHGPTFDIEGPLNCARMPQGQPLLSQAGTSDAGLNLAARSADIMYGSAASIGPARAFYDKVKGRMRAYGREPYELKILPGLLAVTGRTRSEAEDKFDRVQRHVGFESARKLLGGYFMPGIDLTPYEPDDVLPDTPEIRAAAASRGFDLAAAGSHPTMRRLCDWASSCYGHLLVIGTPDTVADVMEEWFRDGAADGFNVWSHGVPGTYRDFVDLVVPELQRRGLHKTSYGVATLRENLGLARPALP